MDDFDRILAGGDLLAPDITPDTAPGHHGAVTRGRTPRWLPGLTFRLRLWPLYRWLIGGRTAVCSCGWRQVFASPSEADHRLADHVINTNRSET